MRLSERLKSVILEAIEESFGPVEVYLFGSRTDPGKRGGDIDIAIVSDMDRKSFRRHKAVFFASLIRKGYDLPIDLVQWRQNDATLLSQEIEEVGIRL